MHSSKGKSRKVETISVRSRGGESEDGSRAGNSPNYFFTEVKESEPRAAVTREGDVGDGGKYLVSSK